MKALWNFDDVQPRVFFPVINKSFPVKMRAPARKLHCQKQQKGTKRLCTPFKVLPYRNDENRTRPKGQPWCSWNTSTQWSLTQTQRNMTLTEKEVLAIVDTLKEFRNILLGHEIVVYMDHENLTLRSWSPWLQQSFASYSSLLNNIRTSFTLILWLIVTLSILLLNLFFLSLPATVTLKLLVDLFILK